MFYSKARHYLFSVSVVYWISFVPSLLRKKNTETHSSFIAKWKYVWNNERLDTLLKVYLRDVQINSFDLRRSGWRWNGKSGKKIAVNKARDGNFICLMWTLQLCIVKLYTVFLNRWKIFMKIKLSSVSCNSNYEQYITASRKTGNMT